MRGSCSAHRAREPQLDRDEQLVEHRLAVGGRQPPEGAVEQQHGEAVDGGPAGDVCSFPAGGGDGPGLDELVEHLPEKQVGRGVGHRGRVIGLDGAERDGEEARLAQRELDVRPAGLAQPRPRPLGGIGLSYAVQPPLHGLLKLGGGE